MRKRPINALRLAALGLVILCVFQALDGRSQPAVTPSRQYIDSATCAGCHREIYQRYQQTSMGRSLFHPSTSNEVEDYKGNNQYYSALSDTHYAMVQRDGAYYQRRWQTGPGGQQINTEDLKIDYVVGAGDQARAYLHQSERGTLIELPLGWYSERGGYWAMSPGFDSKHPPTRRYVSYECLFCHTGYPKLTDQNQSLWTDSVFNGTIPQGVDCQRCHGPGSEHVAVGHQPNATPEKFRLTIVNPAKLQPERQLEVCMQCHLEPTSGNLPSIVRKFNREPYSYVPGQPLEDFASYFDSKPDKENDDRFQLVSAAYRLRKSRCFLESKSALTCLNCHDPHKELPKGQAAAQQYTSACLNCHGAQISKSVAAKTHTPSQDCVSCHMPKRRTQDVVHAVVTDHYIQRKIPSDHLTDDLAEMHLEPSQEYHGPVVPYRLDAAASRTDDDLYTAVAQVLLQNNTKEGTLSLARLLQTRQKVPARFYSVLGDAWASQGEKSKAAAAYQASLAKETSIGVLQSLARVQEEAGQKTLSATTLQVALKANPDEPHTWYQYALLSAKNGKKAEALGQIQKAISLDPDMPQVHFNFANLLLQTGKPQEAMAELQLAFSVDPYDAPAYDLLGQVSASERNFSRAEYLFAKASQLRPGYAPYLYNYALADIQQGRWDDATPLLQAAIKADASYAEAHELLGAIYTRNRQVDAAIEEYGLAVRANSSENRAQLNLGLLLLSKGDMVRARQHLLLAARDSNPAVSKPALEALREAGAP